MALKRPVQPKTTTIDEDLDNKCDICGRDFFTYSNNLKVETENTDITGTYKIESVATGACVFGGNEKTATTFVVNTDKACDVSLSMYAEMSASERCGFANKAERISVTVNGVKVDFGDGTFSASENTSKWYATAYYKTFGIGNVSLEKGNNAIVLTLLSWLNVDYFTFRELTERDV